MNKIVRNSFCGAVTVSTTLFTFVPENVFRKWCVLKNIANKIIIIWKSCPLTPEETAAVMGRILFFVLVFIISFVINKFRFLMPVYISKGIYPICVEYGDLLKWKSWEKRKCLKIIPFDECFTTSIGKEPGDVKKESLCGQYLTKYPIEDMNILIHNAGLVPMTDESHFRNKTRYEPGSLILRDDYLLMAFARLDEDGRGMFESRAEYLTSLVKLWDELDKHYGQRDICIPVLGSGITRIGDVTPTQQELADFIVYSYKLSQHKIKAKIRIICKRHDGFSLSKIGDTI